MAEELADIQTDSASPGLVDSGVIGTGGNSAPVEGGKPEKPLSIREALTASIKEVGDKEQRARDQASGKFIPKEAAPEKVAAATPPKEGIQSPETVKEAQPDGPPPSWSKEDAPHWTTLSPEQKAVVRKREADFQKGIEKYKDKSTRYDEVAQVLAPVRPILQQYGIQSDAQAISRLVDWETAIRSNPVAGIQQLARNFNIDLSQLAQGSPQVDDVPEHLKPVLNQFGQLSQTVSSLQSEINSQREAKVSEELSTFAKDHPHFETVRGAMGQLMNAGLAKDLKDAYDQAIWANPSLRDQILAEREEKRQAEITRTQAEAAKNARLAAVSPPPRARQSVANGSDKGAKNVRGSILSAINELREDTRA